MRPVGAKPLLHFRKQGALFWASVWGIVASFALLAPLAVVVSSPLHTPAPHWAHVALEMLPLLLGETLLLLVGVVMLALCIAAPTAWLVSQYQFPGSRFFRWALVLPLAMPTYLNAYVFASLWGPTGLLSTQLEGVLGIRPNVVNMPGLCLVLALVLFPYIYLPARAVFGQGMSAELEAGRLLGAGTKRSFLSVALPLAWPALAGGALLVAMETLNDFGAVKYYGIHTLTTGIFRSWGGLYDLGSALRLSALLLGLMAIMRWLEQRTQQGRNRTTDQVPVTRKALTGKHSGLAVLWCTTLLMFSIGLPLGKILADVVQLGAQAWPRGTFTALANTMGVALLAAACILAVAVLFAFRERYGGVARGFQRLVGLGYAVPGAVIALGVMALAGYLDRRSVLPLPLIGSIGLLVYAFSVRFVAVGLQPLHAGLRPQSKAMDESARMLGASPWRAFRRVNLPLLQPALVAASVLVVLEVMKELPLTLILRPFGFQTLSTRVYEFASIEQLREASVPALLIILCGVIPVLVLERVFTAKRN
jgi:iron(III) transport system permease protein